jgi:hypothetical protein
MSGPLENLPAAQDAQINKSDNRLDAKSSKAEALSSLLDEYLQNPKAGDCAVVPEYPSFGYCPFDEKLLKLLVGESYRSPGLINWQVSSVRDRNLFFP